MESGTGAPLVISTCTFIRPAIMPIPRSFRDSLKKIIPPLDGSLHKGQSGRVGVIGGAQEYVPSFHRISNLSILNV